MRDTKGRPLKPPRNHTVGIFGISELIFSFETRKQADKYLKMLQAPPDTTARQYALKYKIKELK